MEQEKKDVRVTIMMSEKELARIDEWCHQFRVKSRGEGIRHLIETGMTMPDSAFDVVTSIRSGDTGSDIFSKALGRLEGSVRQYLNGTDISLLDPIPDVETQSSATKTAQVSMDVDSFLHSIVDLVTSTIDASLHTNEGPRSLNGREQRIADMVARGISAAQIADELFLNSAVVDAFINNIEKKLGKKLEPTGSSGPKQGKRQLEIQKPPISR